MAKKDKTMPLEECHSFLSRAQVGRLALFDDEYPYNVPLNFAFVDGKIYVHGAFEGKKMELIARNPKLCFEVDEGEPISPEKMGDCSYSYRSVMVFGEARPLAPEEKELFMKAALGLFQKYTSSHVPEITEKMIHKTQMVEISVHHITGKKSTDLCKPPVTEVIGV